MESVAKLSGAFGARNGDLRLELSTTGPELACCYKVLPASEITSVNVVEIRVESEVAADHAATVEIWVAIASISGGVSSAIASVCM